MCFSPCFWFRISTWDYCPFRSCCDFGVFVFGKKEEPKHEEDHGHHIIPIPVYAGVLGILILGTIITVGVAQIDFGAWNTVIAMFVATIKASFVLLYFMHLKYDNAMNRVIFGSGFFFLLILFAFSIIDIITRIKPVMGFTKF